MIPAAFDYKRAASAAEAISLIGEYGDDAKFLAGGHSLLPLMKLRLAQPSMLIDIGRISDMSYIRDAGDHIAIGALTRHMDVETSAVLAEHVPLLAHAASHVGDAQVRHRGTIGGSIAHADPASDLPATTLALGATYVVQGPNGSREVAAKDFYLGFLESALAPDEIVTEIRVPKMGGARSFDFGGSLAGLGQATRVVAPDNVDPRLVQLGTHGNGGGGSVNPDRTCQRMQGRDKGDGRAQRDMFAKMGPRRRIKLGRLGEQRHAGIVVQDGKAVQNRIARHIGPAQVQEPANRIRQGQDGSRLTDGFQGIGQALAFLHCGIARQSIGMNEGETQVRFRLIRPDVINEITYWHESYAAILK